MGGKRKRAGARPIPKNKRRYIRKLYRWNEEEQNIIQEAAKKLQMKESEFIRKAVLVKGKNVLNQGRQRMATKVSLINMKGGVGKSTITVNLAWHFSAYRNWGLDVLVVDLDPQFNCSQYLLGVNRYEKIIDEEKPTVWDVFEKHTRAPGRKMNLIDPQDSIVNVVNFRGSGRIDLIPSRLDLAFSLKSGGEPKERLLQKTLKKIESNYDLILIDCAPTESILTTAAYLASEYILVPVKPEYLSTIGLPLLVRSMEIFSERYDEHELELLGIVFNASSDYYPEEARSKASVKRLARKYGWDIFQNEITYSRSYPKGAREGKPIFRTSYARTSQAIRFKVFANEFAEKVEL